MTLAAASGYRCSCTHGTTRSVHVGYAAAQKLEPGESSRCGRMCPQCLVRTAGTSALTFSPTAHGQMGHQHPPHRTPQLLPINAAAECIRVILCGSVLSLCLQVGPEVHGFLTGDRTTGPGFALHAAVVTASNLFVHALSLEPFCLRLLIENLQAAQGHTKLSAKDRTSEIQFTHCIEVCCPEV